MTRLEILKQNIHEFAWNHIDDIYLGNLHELTLEDLDEAIKSLASYGKQVAFGKMCPHLNHQFLLRTSKALIKLHKIRDEMITMATLDTSDL